MELNYELPFAISIGNEGARDQAFVPYKDNYTFKLKQGETVAFIAKDSEEGIYYLKQAHGKLVVGAKNVSEEGATKIVSGSYNVSTGEFTAEAGYGIVSELDGYKIVGTIPYVAEPGLGLQPGNVVTLKLSKEGITGKGDLPSGTIVKVTNTGAAGGYNEYKKDAFEDDGSLIVVLNVGARKNFEVQVKWAEEFETYSFDYSSAKLASASEKVEPIRHIEIELPATIKVTNVANRPLGIVLYKENFTQYIAGGDSLTLTGSSVNEVLYLLSQATSELEVEKL